MRLGSCRDPAEERGRECEAASVSRRLIHAARILEKDFGLVVVAALEEDLGTVRTRERGLDDVAGPQPGVSGTLEQRERLVPAAAVVGELREVVGDRGLAAEVAELLVERERLDRVGGEVEPTEADVGPIEQELRVSERVEVAGGTSELDRRLAPLDGLAMVALRLAHRAVPRGQLRARPVR